MRKMLCRFCGNEEPEDSVFCSECGKRLVQPAEKTGEEPAPELEQALPGHIARRIPFATIAIILINVVVAIDVLCETGTLNPSASRFIAFGANYAPKTYHGESWRNFTSMFLHAGVEHLACNMLCLWSFGAILERLMGSVRMTAVYLLAGLFASHVSMSFHETDVCLGASGAVFGLFGAAVTYIAIMAPKLGLNMKSVGGYMANGLCFAGINFIYSLMPGVDMSAHVGGFCAGIALGAVTGHASRTSNRTLSICMNACIIAVAAVNLVWSVALWKKWL
ncbi:MAG: rhomboid family intramembrane serine protease [Kiritimatiellae bacterium]|nr:rhomboid family intramembrane serine protease [Kiritimatiellia bacterium]